MRLDQQDSSAFNTHFKSGKFSHTSKVLSDHIELTLNGSIVNAFDPGVASYFVTLPPLDPGRFYVVTHTGDAGTLEVVDFFGVPVATLDPGTSMLLFSSDEAWTGVSGGFDLDVFGYTGVDHSEGLVPDPGIGPVDPDLADRRFLSELGWSTVTGLAASNAYFKEHRAGGITLSPTGAEIIEFLSANSAISVLAQAGTSPKSIRFTFNAGSVDHDALLNFSADEHVPHSGVDMVAGVGLSGGGTINASRTFDFAPSELTTSANPVLADYAVMDLAAGAPRKARWSVVQTILDHNLLLNYSADRHIAHSGVSIVGSTGLTGGGDITASRSIALSINSLGVDSPSTGDLFAFYNSSSGDHSACNFTTLNGALDHNALANYVADQHVAHSAVSISTTNGIQGGGNIAASRTLSLDNPVNGELYVRENTGWTAIPRVTVGSTPPPSPEVGDIWVDTT